MFNYFTVGHIVHTTVTSLTLGEISFPRTSINKIRRQFNTTLNKLISSSDIAYLIWPR